MREHDSEREIDDGGEHGVAAGVAGGSDLGEVRHDVRPGAAKDLLEDIDGMIRNKKDISEILKVTNQKILKDNFGLSSSDIQIAEGIWKKLSERRLNRGK